MNKFFIACVILGTLCVSQVSAQTATCKPGFWWDGQKCDQCSQNCATCTAPSSCTACMDTYYLSNNSCLPCGNPLIAGVKQCCAVGGDANAIRATACLTGYYLDGSVCIMADPNCMTRVGSTMICQTCNNGYYLDQHNVCVSGTLTGCSVYTNMNNCMTCQSGYYLSPLTDTNGYSYQGCTACNANCLCTASTNLCTGCVSGAYQSQAAGVTQISCSTCTAATNLVTQRTPLKCNASGCLLTDSTSCPSDSVCVGSGGVNTCQAIANCVKVAIQSNALTCTTCQSGYYPQNNACTLCNGSNDPTQDYAKCTSNVAITQCPQTIWTIPFTNANYLVPNPTATPANTLQCIQNVNNCRTMKDSGQACTACYAGWVLLNGACVTCSSLDQNCIACAATTATPQVLQCTACTNNVNSPSATNYYVKSDKSGCLPYPSMVMSCATNSDTQANLATCTCISGYKVQQGTETTCVACSDNNCTTCGDKTVAGTSTCTKCNPGYGVVNSACSKCTLNCMNCDSNASICKTCNSGYFMVGQVCSLKRDHCTTYDSNGCSVCEYNYYKNSQSCTRCSDVNILTTVGGVNYGAYERIGGSANCVAVTASTCSPVAPPAPVPSSSSTATTSTSTTSIPSSSTNSTTPSASTSSSNSSNIVSYALALVISLFLLF